MGRRVGDGAVGSNVDELATRDRCLHIKCQKKALHTES